MSPSKKPARLNEGRIPCRLHCRTVRASIDLQAVSAIVGGLDYPSILGANPAVAEAEGFSYWAAEPRDMFEVTTNQNDPLGKLQRTLAQV